MLSDFDPALKTKDLMDLCREWEDDRGGFKVKWRDDTSAWIVFADAAVGESHLSYISPEDAEERTKSFNFWQNNEMSRRTRRKCP